MDHSQYREQLSALLDGELDEILRAQVTAHLAECADCQAYFAELTALHDALNDMEEFDPPADFAGGVLERLHSETALPRKKRRSLRGWAGLAACAAVAVLAVNALPGLSGGGNSVRVASAPAAAGGAAPVAPPMERMEAAAAETPDEWLETQMLYTSIAPEAPKAAMDATTQSRALVEAEPATAGTIVTEVTNGPETAEDALLTLTLSGAGAADWLAEHGWQGESGDWYVGAAALRALPEGLALCEPLPEGCDGVVRVEAVEPPDDAPVEPDAPEGSEDTEVTP